MLRDVQDLGKDAAAELVETLGQLPRDAEVAVVATHPGGAKARQLAERLAGLASVVRCDPPSGAGAHVEFVTAEVRAAGGRIDGAAAAALVAGVGTDLRELATACAQLVADSGGVVDQDVVARYHRGRAEVSGFTVADKAVEGDLAGAVELLRWALAVGVAPVLVTSSLAANLRLVARVAGEGRAAPARVAKTLGQPPWKVEKAMRWARGWSPAGLARALAAVAVADAEVKGAAADAQYACERAVLLVAGARRG